MKDELVLITGAGGFIGGAMVAQFRRQGYRKIRASGTNSSTTSKTSSSI